MSNPFRKKTTTRLAEIHEYTQDLQRVTILRDKCTHDKEVESYNNIIKIMQEVLAFLNSKVIPK